MSGIRIIETEDGSHSLYHEQLRETYHSTHGALRESKHVFIAMGLDFYLENNNPDVISVFEMGFGTGLNVVLALEWANNNVPIRYDSIEAFPIPYEIAQQLNYFNDDPGLRKSLLDFHQLEWGNVYEICSHFTFRKVLQKIQDYHLPESSYDVIFFDAFAPSKQGEVWSLDILSKFTSSLKTGGVLVTYCAKGQLKRDLKTLGCIVESIPGPPGKMEMTRATRIHEPRQG